MCQGIGENLRRCGGAELGLFEKLRWDIRKIGLWNMIRYRDSRALRALGWKQKKKGILRALGWKQRESAPRNTNGMKAPWPPFVDEVLNLEVGEWVEVRPLAEIEATLLDKRTCRGLFFMPDMSRFCGQRLRVYKKVKRIALESTGEVKTVRNTVFLEGAICDGQPVYGCDRSCFYFWREAWLRRVSSGESSRAISTTPAPVADAVGGSG